MIKTLLTGFFLIIIISISCTKEVKLSISPYKALISDFNYSYDVLLKKTNKVVGKSSINLNAIKRQNKVFYEVKQYFEISKEQSNDVKDIMIKSASTLDANFKLRIFNSTIIEEGESSKREGYYRPPYYYIDENGIKSKLKASKPLYSSIVEHYIIRKLLKKPGSSARYFFFNIVSLQAEEEIISFEGFGYKANRDTKEYTIVNSTNNYKSYYSTDKDNNMISKTDFNSILLWQLQ